MKSLLIVLIIVIAIAASGIIKKSERQAKAQERIATVLERWDDGAY